MFLAVKNVFLIFNILRDLLDVIKYRYIFFFSIFKIIRGLLSSLRSFLDLLDSLRSGERFLLY